MAEEQKKIKKFPNNFEAEQALLCCILTDGNVSVDVVPTAGMDLFYNERHTRIFGACKDLYRNSQPIDAITVNDQLERNHASDLNMMEYLVELTSVVPSSANYQEYLRVLNRDMVLRKIITASNKIIEEAYSSADEFKTLDFAEQQIYAITANFFRGDLQPIAKASTELMGRIDAMSQNKNAFKGLPTHYRLLDKLTNGLQKGDLIILAARPSVGKTSFALNLISNIVNKGDKGSVIALFSLEMPAVQLAQRVLAASGNVTMGSMSGGRLTDNEQEELWKIHTVLSESKVYIDDTAMESPGDVISKCRRLYGKEKRLDFVVIDYLQLMVGDKGRSDASKQQEVSDISRMMKVLAKEMNCPVLVLSQMSRGIESRDDKTPKLSDLRESGAIEQDADIVFFLSREDENDFGKPEYAVLLDVAKHRNGQLATIRFDWHGSNVRFDESKDQTVNRVFKTAKKGGQ